MSLSLPFKGGKQVGLNKKQADAIRERVKKKRDARELAREEERNYVEFRKMEILYQFRPKSIAASRNADDSFPRRRRGVSMGFGERKAYFLSIRPNPKFATWFGKKKHQPPADNKNKILLPISPAPVRQTVIEKSQIVDEDDEEDLSRRSAKKGINASNPFIKGCPFWTVATGDEEEMAEDDYPVDIEAIEKVVNGAELKRPPYVRKDFQVFAADVETFKKDDILFDRELIFGNTVTTVLNLFCADSARKSTKKKAKTTSMSAEKCVTWANTISITTFDVENREPKKRRVPQEEPMKNVVRMSAEGSKE
ncbi:unnamed protein product [Cylicocyclus nassatus]|uniref:Uncharacterized protein n=1 Tax=Cylicocyclus nassatus TaxID=53992 RepID=A0AA36DN30_CYLNA|nr:unnamed protein product [Cylicocyclus nassatus]